MQCFNLDRPISLGRHKNYLSFFFFSFFMTVFLRFVNLNDQT
jgi:hypothetical protein